LAPAAFGYSSTLAVRATLDLAIQELAEAGPGYVVGGFELLVIGMDGHIGKLFKG